MQINNVLLWIVTTCGHVFIYYSFGEICYLHLQGGRQKQRISLNYYYFRYSKRVSGDFSLPQRIDPIFLTLEEGTEVVRKILYGITTLLTQKRADNNRYLSTCKVNNTVVNNKPSKQNTKPKIR